MATPQVNLLANAVRGREAFQVAEQLLWNQFGGQKPTEKIVVNLAPCAKALFRSPRDSGRFEKSVSAALAA